MSLDALTVRLLVYKLINAHSYLPWIQKKGEVRITNVPFRMHSVTRLLECAASAANEDGYYILERQRE